MTRNLCMALVAVIGLGMVGWLPAYGQDDSGDAPAGHGKKGGDAAKASVFGGEVTAVAADSITVVRRTDKGGEVTKTITVNAETKVVLQGKGKKKDGEGDQKPELVPGTIADVKVGCRVKVTLTADGTTATEIGVHHARQGKKGKAGGEGGKPAGAPQDNGGGHAEE